MTIQELYDFLDKFIKDAEAAGVSLDAFKTKAQQAFQLTDIPTSFAQMLETLEQTQKFDPSSLISSLQELKSTLIELFDVMQRATGQFSASKLSEQFEEIKVNAEKLKGVKLNTKDGKESAKAVLEQYEDYLAHGGTLNISDIGATKNLERYMTKHLGEAESARAAEEEARALKLVEEAANTAAEAKQKFADANSQLFQSVITSLSGIDNEGKAFENMTKLRNSLAGTKGDEKLKKLVDGLTQIKDLMSTELGSNSLIKSLENLSQSGDALKDLATIIKASKKQIEDAQNAVSPEATAAKSYLSDDIEAIKERGKAE